MVNTNQQKFRFYPKYNKYDMYIKDGENNIKLSLFYQNLHKKYNKSIWTNVTNIILNELNDIDKEYDEIDFIENDDEIYIYVSNLFIKMEKLYKFFNYIDELDKFLLYLYEIYNKIKDNIFESIKKIFKSTLKNINKKYDEINKINNFIELNDHISNLYIEMEKLLDELIFYEKLIKNNFKNFDKIYKKHFNKDYIK